MGLTGEFGDEFEVGVVVQHSEASGLRHRGDERIDERQGTMLTLFGEQLLEFECSSISVTGTDSNAAKRFMSA